MFIPPFHAEYIDFEIIIYPYSLVLTTRLLILKYSPFIIKPTPSSGLDQLTQEYNLSHLDYILIEKYVTMKQEGRDALASFILGLSATLSESDKDFETEAAPGELYGNMPDNPTELEKQFPPIKNPNKKTG